MSMTDKERDQLIAEKLNEGLKLADVQRLLADEYNMNMTYMELRMIAADLEVNWQKQEPEKPAEEPEDENKEKEELVPQDEMEITISKLVRPGAAMSGDVVFKSGIKAEWFVDPYGRLGLNPSNEEQKPSPEEVQEFQVELQKKLAGGAM